jgi:hypothetical protein
MTDNLEQEHTALELIEMAASCVDNGDEDLQGSLNELSDAMQELLKSEANLATEQEEPEDKQDADEIARLETECAEHAAEVYNLAVQAAEISEKIKGYLEQAAELIDQEYGLEDDEESEDVKKSEEDEGEYTAPELVAQALDMFGECDGNLYGILNEGPYGELGDASGELGDLEEELADKQEKPESDQDTDEIARLETECAEHAAEVYNLAVQAAGIAGEIQSTLEQAVELIGDEYDLEDAEGEE